MARVSSPLNLAGSIVTLAVGIPTIAVFAVDHFTGGLPDWMIPAVIGAVCATLFIGALSRVIIGRFSTYARGYSWRTAVYTFTVGDETSWKNHTNDVVIKIRATRSGVRVFENRYAWTGSGTESLPEVLSAGHVLLGQPYRDNNWHHYFIYLQRPLRRGETATIHIRQAFVDTNGQVGSFHTKTIYERCREVQVITKFSNLALKTTTPTAFQRVVYRRDEPRAKVLDRSDTSFTQGAASSTFKRPRLRQRLGLEWSWSPPSEP